ncbi:MAG: hypothetical protein DHS20C15_24380 [Planctomycetota bacterium]|nr:MAG: hypothetical protein DHS20C15_24380 [Planctomycetota bacterium]
MTTRSFAWPFLAAVLVAIATLMLFSSMAPQGVFGPRPQVAGPQYPVLGLIGGHATIAGIPAPSQMHRVVEGSPFTVPAGKLFVVTGLGSTGYTLQATSSKRVQAFVNGTPALAALMTDWAGGGSYAGGGPAIPAVPPGFVVAEGETVSVEDPSIDAGVVLGYLADI